MAGDIVTFAFLASETTDYDYESYSGCVGEFTLADAECDYLLVLTTTVAVRTEMAWNGHRAKRDVRRMRKVT